MSWPPVAMRQTLINYELQEGLRTIPSTWKALSVRMVRPPAEIPQAAVDLPADQQAPNVEIFREKTATNRPECNLPSLNNIASVEISSMKSALNLKMTKCSFIRSPTNLLVIAPINKKKIVFIRTKMFTSNCNEMVSGCCHSTVREALPLLKQEACTDDNNWTFPKFKIFWGFRKTLSQEERQSLSRRDRSTVDSIRVIILNKKQFIAARNIQAASER